MADALECPVCLTLPDGEVHQCNNGHCYCVECWNELVEPRRCPECRQALPQINRNRAQEERIAALLAKCKHCGEATTRGTKEAHEGECPHRPVTCMGAAAGCGWAGLAAEQPAHEAACPLAGCQRLVAPLQAKCDGLQAQNQQLQMLYDGLQVRCDRLLVRSNRLNRNRLQAALEPLQEQNQQLVTQNEKLEYDVRLLQAQFQVQTERFTATGPLEERVKLFEGDDETGRWQRQRTGPAQHDATPSGVAVAAMGLAEAVAALRAHGAVARVAAAACNRISALCFGFGEGNRQRAADAGVLESVVVAMRVHLQATAVQEQGCLALSSVCIGTNAAGLARLQRAADACAFEALVVAMRTHPQAAGVQVHGCGTLGNMCIGGGAAGLARLQRAVDAEVPEAVVGAMRAHQDVVDVQRLGFGTLRNLWWQLDPALKMWLGAYPSGGPACPW